MEKEQRWIFSSVVKTEARDPLVHSRGKRFHSNPTTMMMESSLLMMAMAQRPPSQCWL
jgi:hypothetical protein